MEPKDILDKEIIIDGIDVSECEQIVYKDSLNPICGNTDICCYGRKDCCFKQLARKTQECEDLRQYHNKCCEEFKKEKQDLIDKYNQLSINFYNGDYCNTEHCSLLKSKEQECEELKEEIKHYKQIAQYHGNLSVKYTNKSAKFKQCLTEIKEIAEKDFRHTAWEEYAKQLQQILQKISEVEDEM